MADLQSKTLQERMIAILNLEHSLSYKPHDLTFQEACNKWLIETGTINGVDYSSIGLNKYSAKEALSIIRHKDNISSETLTELIHELGPYYPIHKYTAQEALNKKSAMLVPYSLSFDGVDDYVEVSNDSSLEPVDAISISTWVRAESYIDYQVVIEKPFTSSASPYFDYALAFSSASSKKIRFRLGTSEVLSATEITLDTWHNICATYDKTSMKLYINGVLDSTESNTSSIATSSENLTIGKSKYFANREFDGKIDEVSIFNKALTQAEVTSLYASNPQNAGDAVGVDNLTAYWKMDHGSGPVARDVSVAETLGSEIVTDIASWTDSADITTTIDVSTNTVTMESDDASSYATIYLSAAGILDANLALGFYKVSFNASWTVAPNIKQFNPFPDGSLDTHDITEGENEYYIHVTNLNPNHHISIAFNNADGDITFSNVSVKQVTNGNHGTINGATWTVH